MKRKTKRKEIEMKNVTYNQDEKDIQNQRVSK